jgi:phosphoglycolate phosphatase
VFGHTEASDVNISSRIRALGLNEVLEEVYARRFEGMPHPLGSDYVMPSADGNVRVTSFTARKPDPTSIKAMLTSTGAIPDRCLYVGDSLVKDVAMAKRAGVHAAWARYGTDRDPQLWRKLVEITDWDAKSVEAVKDITTVPDVTIDSFKELLLHFTFSAS